jgi:transcriptional regulator with XRE-family HTH domain
VNQERLQREVRRVLNDCGGAVKRARESRGLSQTALATAAGTTSTTISAIERGQHAPSVEMLARLALALDVGLKLDLPLIPPRR